MCLALLVLAVKADDIKLVVNLANGASQQEFVVSDIGKLAFDENSFSIIAKDGTVSPFNFEQVRSIKFADITTGIGTIDATTNGLKPYYRNGYLGIDGWQGGEKAQATVYNVSGMTVVRMNNWDGTPIPTDNLASGVYIFNVNNNTIKFVKQ